MGFSPCRLFLHLSPHISTQIAGAQFPPHAHSPSFRIAAEPPSPAFLPSRHANYCAGFSSSARSRPSEISQIPPHPQRRGAPALPENEKPPMPTTLWAAAETRRAEYGTTSPASNKTA